MSDIGEIGEGGLLLICDQELPIGQSVVVNFIIPGATGIVRGEVKNSPAENTFGIQFFSCPFELKRRIRDYVSAKSEEEAKVEMKYDIA